MAQVAVANLGAVHDGPRARRQQNERKLAVAEAAGGAAREGKRTQILRDGAAGSSAAVGGGMKTMRFSGRKRKSPATKRAKEANVLLGRKRSGKRTR